MFQQEDGPFRFHHPGQLPQTLYGIGDRTEHEGGHGRIEAVVRELQVLHIHFAELDRDPLPPGPLAGFRQHAVAQVDPADFGAFRVEGHVLAGAYADLQNLSGRHPFPDLISPNLGAQFHEEFQAVVEAGEAVVASLGQGGSVVLAHFGLPLDS